MCVRTSAVAAVVAADAERRGRLARAAVDAAERGDAQGTMAALTELPFAERVGALPGAIAAARAAGRAEALAGLQATVKTLLTLQQVNDSGDADTAEAVTSTTDEGYINLFDVKPDLQPRFDSRQVAVFALGSLGEEGARLLEEHLSVHPKLRTLVVKQICASQFVSDDDLLQLYNSKSVNKVTRILFVKTIARQNGLRSKVMDELHKQLDAPDSDALLHGCTLQYVRQVLEKRFEDEILPRLAQVKPFASFTSPTLTFLGHKIVWDRLWKHHREVLLALFATQVEQAKWTQRAAVYDMWLPILKKCPTMCASKSLYDALLAVYLKHLPTGLKLPEDAGGAIIRFLASPEAEEGAKLLPQHALELSSVPQWVKTGFFLQPVAEQWSIFKRLAIDCADRQEGHGPLAGMAVRKVFAEILGGLFNPKKATKPAQNNKSRKQCRRNVLNLASAETLEETEVAKEVLEWSISRIEATLNDKRFAVTSFSSGRRGSSLQISLVRRGDDLSVEDRIELHKQQAVLERNEREVALAREELEIACYFVDAAFSCQLADTITSVTKLATNLLQPGLLAKALNVLERLEQLSDVARYLPFASYPTQNTEDDYMSAARVLLDSVTSNAFKVARIASSYLEVFRDESPVVPLARDALAQSLVVFKSAWTARTKVLNASNKPLTAASIPSRCSPLENATLDEFYSFATRAVIAEQSSKMARVFSTKNTMEELVLSRCIADFSAQMKTLLAQKTRNQLETWGQVLDASKSNLFDTWLDCGTRSYYLGGRKKHETDVYFDPSNNRVVAKYLSSGVEGLLQKQMVDIMKKLLESVMRQITAEDSDLDMSDDATAGNIRELQRKAWVLLWSTVSGKSCENPATAIRAVLDEGSLERNNPDMPRNVVERALRLIHLCEDMANNLELFPIETFPEESRAMEDLFVHVVFKTRQNGQVQNAKSALLRNTKWEKRPFWGKWHITWLDRAIHKGMEECEDKVLREQAQNAARAFDKAVASKLKEALRSTTFSPGRREAASALLKKSLEAGSPQMVTAAVAHIVRSSKNETGPNRLIYLQDLASSWEDILNMFFLDVSVAEGQVVKTLSGPAAPQAQDEEKFDDFGCQVPTDAQHSELIEQVELMVNYGLGATNTDRDTKSTTVSTIQGIVNRTTERCFVTGELNAKFSLATATLPVRRQWYEACSRALKAVHDMSGGRHLILPVAKNIEEPWSTLSSPAALVARDKLIEALEAGGASKWMTQQLRQRFFAATHRRKNKRPNSWIKRCLPGEAIELLTAGYHAAGCSEPFSILDETGHVKRDSTELKRVMGLIESLEMHFVLIPGLLESARLAGEAMIADPGVYQPHELDQFSALMCSIELECRLWYCVPSLRELVKGMFAVVCESAGPGKEHHTSTNRSVVGMYKKLNRSVLISDTIGAMIEKEGEEGVAHREVMSFYSGEVGRKKAIRRQEAIDFAITMVKLTDKSAVNLDKVRRPLALFRQDLLSEFIASSACDDWDELEGLFQQNVNRFKRWMNYTAEDISEEKARTIGFRVSYLKHMNPTKLCDPTILAVSKQLWRDFVNRELAQEKRDHSLRTLLSLPTQSSSSVLKLIESQYALAAEEMEERNMVQSETQASISILISQAFSGEDPLRALAYLLSPDVIAKDMSNATAQALKAANMLLPEGTLVDMLRLALSPSRREVLRVGLHKTILQTLASIGNAASREILMEEWRSRQLHRDARQILVQSALDAIGGDEDSNQEMREWGFAVLTDLGAWRDSTARTSKAVSESTVWQLISLVFTGRPDLDNAADSLASLVANKQVFRDGYRELSTLGCGLDFVPQLLGRADRITRPTIRLQSWRRLMRQVVLPLAENRDGKVPALISALATVVAACSVVHMTLADDVASEQAILESLAARYEPAKASTLDDLVAMERARCDGELSDSLLRGVRERLVYALVVGAMQASNPHDSGTKIGERVATCLRTLALEPGVNLLVREQAEADVHVITDVLSSLKSQNPRCSTIKARVRTIANLMTVASFPLLTKLGQLPSSDLAVKLVGGNVWRNLETLCELAGQKSVVFATKKS